MKLLFIFGTRPEFNKVYPVYIEAKNRGHDVILINTGQHREMLDPHLKLFNVKEDYNLNVIDNSDSLVSILTSTLLELDKVIKKEENIDIIFVHGDTSATLAGSLVAFYNQIYLAHIEAGLRTHNKYNPFPEEMNRHLAGVMSDLHLAPTEVSKQNLLNENISEDKIHIVGNTSIDLLKYTIKEDYTHPILEWKPESKLILITVHRRENLDKLKVMFEALNELAVKYENEYKFVYPIHMNPKIREIANEYLVSDNLKVIEPLGVIDFHNLMNKSYLILTDSGGIQEEAPALDVPVLVLRNTTERPEGVTAGTLQVIGTEKSNIISKTSELLENKDLYNKMSSGINPYGDGNSSQKIIDIIDKL